MSEAESKKMRDEARRVAKKIADALAARGSAHLTHEGVQNVVIAASAARAQRSSSTKTSSKP